MRIAILAACLMIFFTTRAQLVVNEFSQGASGNKEYIELLVIGTRTCNDSTADLRGWIIDDQNGWYTGANIGAGHYRFANNSNWQAVPYGSIILLYNNADPNTNPSFPADDPTDADKNFVYVVPVNGSAYIEDNNNTPSNAFSPYVPGAYSNPPAQAWLTRMSLANGSDAIILVNPNNTLNTASFSLNYGTAALITYQIPTVQVGSVNINQNCYLTDSKYNTSSSWSIGTGPSFETPGQPNGGANTAWIESMRKKCDSTKLKVNDTVQCYNPNSFIFTNLSSDNDCYLPKNYQSTWFLISDNSHIGSGIGTSNLTPTIQTLGTAVTGGGYNANGLRVDNSSSWPNNTFSNHANHYVEFKLTPKACKSISLNTFTWEGAVTGGGTSDHLASAVRYSIDGGVTFNYFGGGDLPLQSGTSQAIQYIHTLGTSVTATNGTPLIIRLYLFTDTGFAAASSSRRIYVKNVNILGTSDIDPLVNTTTYQWDFGDATSYTGVTPPAHTYSSSGIFKVKLAKSKYCGTCIDSALLNIQVLPPPLIKTDTIYGCNMVVLNGNTYTSSTIVNDTIRSAPPDNCDSIYNVHHVFIQNITPITVSDTVFGCGSVVYNSVTYNTSTILQDTIKSAAPYNCDSVYRFHHINVQNLTPVTVRDTVYGCGSVVYGGVTYTASVVLNDTIKSVAPYNCDSVYRFHHINVQNITPVTVRDTVYGCGSVVYGGNTYTSSIVLKDTIKSAAPYNCDSVYRFHHINVQNITPVTVRDTVYGCGSVVYGGNTYTSSIVLKDTIKSAAPYNCDSVYRFHHINVQNITPVTVRDTVYGCGSVVYGGNTYTSSVVLNDTIKSVAPYNCDSVYRFHHINVQNITPVTVRDTVYGCGSVVYGGNTYTSSVVLNDTIKSVAPYNCDSVYRFHHINVQNLTPVTVRDTVYGCGSVVYGGVTYTSSTILNDTIKSVAPYNCDSIYRFHHVNVQNLTPVTVRDTVYGCGSVVYGGVTYTALVVLNDTIKSAAPYNCDSIYRFHHINVQNLTPVTVRDTVYGCESVVYGGVTYTSSTILNDTIKSVAPYNCDSIYRFHHIVVQNITPVVQNDTLRGCTLVVFSGTTYTSSTIIKDTIHTAISCDSIYKNTHIIIAAPPVNKNDTITGCTSVTFLGVTYTSSASVKDTLKTMYGCDSVYRTTQINVGAPPSSQTNNLYGCGSVLFQGTTYTVNSILYDTLQGVQGCDSIYITTNINVQNLTPVTVRDTVYGCGSVVYNGNTYTSSTVLQDTIKSAAPFGCDSIYSFHHINVQNITPVTIRDTVYGCGSVVYNGVTYTSSVVLNDTIKSVAPYNCDSIYRFHHINVQNITPVTVRDTVYGCGSVVYGGVTYTASVVLNDTIKSVAPYNCDSVYRFHHINVQNLTPVTVRDTVYGCGSVVYGGVTYTASVVLNDTIKSVAPYNCDSIYSFHHIVVQNITPVVQNDTLRGCTLVVFSGTTYTSSTIIKDTIHTAISCDSIYKNTHIIIAAPPVNKNDTITGCTSVTFLGVTYTSSASVKDTLKTMYGCDSVYRTTQINVGASPSSQTNNLYGCGSVLFQGTTYTVNSILYDTLQGVQGCDSIYITTNINVQNLTPVTVRDTVYGCGSVVYNGNTYTSSTVLQDTIKSAAPFGCDSIYSFHHINVQNITPVTIRDTVYGCGSVVYNGVTYTSSVVLNDTIKSVAPYNCDSIYRFHHINVQNITPVTVRDTVYGCGSVVYGGVTYTASVVLNDTIKSVAPYNCDSVYRFHHINVQNLTPVTVRDTVYGCGSVVYNSVTYTSSTVLNDTLKSAAPYNCDSVYRFHHINVQNLTPVTVRDTVYGCGSVVYGGNTYTSSIVLKDTINSAAPYNCDSLYIITHIKVGEPAITRNDTLTGCISVIFNGITYTTSTIVNDTLVSAQGCDSLYIITHIKVGEPAITRNDTLSGCTSVIFNGITYTTSTIVNDTLVSVQGCDSLYIITHIKVGEPATTRNDTLTGCTSVIFNGITYTTSIIVNDTLVSAQGCDSLYINTHINVGEPATTRNDTLTGCTSVLFNGITYTTSTIVNDTLVSTQGCDSLYINTHIIIGEPSFTRNDTITGCTSVLFNGVTYTTSTIVNDTLVSVQGCDSLYINTHILIGQPAIIRNDTLTGCTSVIFNGTTYTTSTIVNDTLVSVQGCDSLYTNTHIIIGAPAIVRNDTLTGCTSVLFNGVTYTTSTIVNDTLVSVQGCDSLYINTHIIIGEPAIVRNDTITGCTSVLFNGVTYTTSTIVNDTLVSVQGCDSLYINTHIIIGAPAIVRNDTLTGCTSVLFNGITYTSSTVVNDTLVSVQGCDSLYINTHIIIGAPAIVRNDTLTGCTSVVFNGITYTTSTIVNDTLASVQGCDSLYINTHIIIGAPAIVRNDTLTGCTSVLFNGVTYTTSTIINDTLVSVQGCDSLYINTHIIIGAPAIVRNDTLTGCTSVLFNGVTYTTSTIINDTLVSVQGCDSLYINTHIIIGAPAIVRNDTLTGCTSVLFNGVTYTVSTIVNDTLVSTQGCDSLYINTHIIIGAPAIVRNDTITGCTSVLFNGVIYTVSTIVNDTLVSTQGCDSLYIITHIKVGEPATTRNDTLSGCTSVIFNGITYATSTIVNDTLVSAQGCDSLYIITHIKVGEPAITRNDTLSGCTSVVFNGVTYTISTIVNDTLVSVQGCDSLYIITHIKVGEPAITRMDTLTGCTSVLFNGITYTTSTIVNDTLVSAQGCDSLYIITHIKVGEPAITRNDTLSGCTSVVFNGVTYTTSTIVNDTLVSTQGCDSLYINTHIIIGEPAIVRNDTITGCTSVLFNGVTHTTSTIVNDTLASVQGCDSLYIITHIKVGEPAITRNDTLTGCTSVLFNGITYTTSTIVNDTLVSTQGCDSLYIITHIKVGEPAITRNDTLSGCTSIVFNSITYTTSTIVNDTLISTQGCDSLYINTHIIIGAPAIVRNDTITGCTSVLFNGVTYTTSSIINDTLVSVQGCDSLYINTHIIIGAPAIVGNDTLTGCTSVVFNGITYTTSTIVNDTLVSAQGCDSLYINTHIIIGAPAIVRNDTLTGCTSVLFNGVTHTTSTIVNDTLASVQGCDSLYINTHIIIGAPAILRNDTITGCTSVIFNGITYTSSTVVNDTLVSTQGCDSLYIITHIKVGEPAVTRNDTLSGCTSVIFNGITYTTSAIVNDALVSTQGCDSLYINTHIIIGAPAIVRNDTLTGCTSVVFNGITYTSSTVVNDTLVSVQGCDSLYIITHIKVGEPAITRNDTLTGCTSVVFNGVTYTTSTIVNDTLVSVQGCDSLYINTHIIIGAPAIVRNDTLTGCTSVLFNGVTYTTSTIVNDTLVSAQGCDSLYINTHIIIGAPAIVGNDTLTGCTSVVFNGITYTTSTIVNDTLVSVQGCDSLYIITHIKVGDPAITRNDTITGCTSVLFNGVTYTTSTIVNDTLVSVQGCDSLYINTHIIIGAPAIVRNDTLTGCTSVLFNGVTYTTSTIINDTLVSVQGCDSLYINTHIIIGAPAIVRNDTLTGCTSVLFNGVTYTTSTIVNDTLVNAQGCDSLYIITHIKVGEPATTRNDTLTGCTSVLFNGVTYTTSTIVNDTLVSAQGCDSLYIITHIKVGEPAITHNDTLSGCTSVVFNGITYTTSTIVNDTLVSVQGCDSLYIITHIKVGEPTITRMDTLTGCTSVLFNGITYTTSTIVNDTLVSAQGCDSLYIITHIKVGEPATTRNDTLNGCTSVIFNGITYTTSTIVNDTLVSVQGCDSLYINTHIIIGAPAFTRNDTLTGCTSVLFNGVTYTVSTIVNDTLVSTQGCDSLYINTHIIIGAPAIVRNDTITGCTSVLFNGVTYTVSTIVNDTLVSVQGCDSLYIITHIIIQGITPVAQNLTASGCNSVIFEGNTYGTSTLLKDTIKAIMGCDSIYRQIQITVYNILPTTQSNTITGCNSIVYLGVTYTTSAVLSDTVRSTYGCDSIFNITNINVQSITPANETQQLNGCGSVTYNGNTYFTSTIVKDTIKSINGCDSVYRTTNINIQNISPVTISNSIGGCGSVVYNGNTYTTSTLLRDTIRSTLGCDSIYNHMQITVYTVTTVTQTTAISGCNSLVYLGNTYTTSTTLRDTIKTVNGCDSVYKVINITVQSITPVVRINDLYGCGSLLFNGTVYNNSATVKDTLRTVLGCDSVFRTTNIYVQHITRVNQTSNLTGCNSVTFNGKTYTTSTQVKDTLRSYYSCDSVYRTTNIFVSVITAVTQNAQLKGCTNVVFNGKTYTTSTVVRDTVRSVFNCDSIYNVTQITIATAPVVQNINLAGCDTVVYRGVKYTSSTTVKDTLRTTAGCDSMFVTATITITPFKLQLTASPNPADHGSIVNFTASSSSSFNVLAWLPLNAFTSQNTDHNILVADTTMRVTVIGQSSLGCIDTASVVLQLNVAKDFYIPNAFSPNNDGHNDMFKVYSTALVEVEIKIFNQYGELVFEAKDNKGWDGMYKGKQQPVGVYSYVITSRLVGSQPFVKKGMFNLIR